MQNYKVTMRCRMGNTFTANTEASSEFDALYQMNVKYMPNAVAVKAEVDGIGKLQEQFNKALHQGISNLHVLNHQNNHDEFKTPQDYLQFRHKLPTNHITNK